MDNQGKPVARPMKYPYTFTAKIAQFPLRFYVKNNWLYRYYLISVLCCIPIFYKIERLSKSPANYEKYYEFKRKEAEGHGF